MIRAYLSMTAPLRSRLGSFIQSRACKQAVVCLVAVLSVACGRAPESKEAIRQGVIDAVAGRVNLTQMDVDVTTVSFKGQEAEAMVDFRPKGGAPGSGIQMKYTLEQKNGKWVVKQRAESGANPHSAEGGAPGAPGGSLPSGHPPIPPPEGKK
ncbi:MAG: hypothetical protein ACRD8O_14350 [Bryobacteraceae bacterium]